MKRDVRQKIAMYLRQDGLCHWCKKPMALAVGINFKGPNKYSPKDLATVDHIDSRLSGERGQHPGEYRKVVACAQCNQARAAVQERLKPLDELQRRSERGARTQEDDRSRELGYTSFARAFRDRAVRDERRNSEDTPRATGEQGAQACD